MSCRGFSPSPGHEPPATLGGGNPGRNIRVYPAEPRSRKAMGANPSRFSPFPARARSLLLPGPPPLCRLLPLPTPAPSSRPPPPAARAPGSRSPDAPTHALPPPLTLTRRATRADTAHGRAPKHVSPRPGLGPSACRRSGSSSHRGGENLEKGRG